VKKSLIILLCLWLSGCATTQSNQDRWFSSDKAYHFLGSALIAGTGTSVAGNQGVEDDELMPIVFGATVSLGVFKEGYDVVCDKEQLSWKDLFWDVLGTVAGFFLGQMI
jgi:putative lipoprotein